jgi:hypothetical protein
VATCDLSLGQGRPVTGQEALPHASADRRDDPFVEAGVRMGGSSVREAKAEVAHPHLGLMAMCLAQRKMGVCLILVPQRIILSSKYPLLSD